MQGFVAFVWTSRAESAGAEVARKRDMLAAQRPHYSVSFEAPGLVIYEAPPQSSADGGQSFATGRLVGAAFEGRNRTKAAALSAHAAAPRRLIDAVWGRYVAFIQDAAQSSVFVVRDPSGALPCFWCASAGAHIFFSDPDDCEAFEAERREIDWGYVCERLFDNRTLSLATAFKGVRELAPGAMAIVSGGRCSLDALWTLERVAARAHGALSPDEARQALRDAVVLSCGAWGGCVKTAGVRLSGGFDSAIVASALRPALGAAIGLNFATPTAEGDERHFARAAARHAGIKLVEHVRDPERVSLAAEVEKASGCRPPLWLADAETDVVEAAFAKAHGLEVFFSGRGGDNVFFRTERPFGLADILTLRGHLAWLSAGWRQAQVSGRPYPSLLKDSHALTTLGGVVRAPPSYLTAKAHALRLHPPEEDPALAPGKRRHVLMIEDRTHYFDRRPHADYLYPLVSQPVIEACLALPTFVLCAEGQERSLARAALKDLAPQQILDRRSKGQTTNYLMSVIVKDLPFLRGVLMDGMLVEQGFVDRAALSAMLDQGALMKAPQHMAHLVGALSVEAWLRRIGV